MMGRTSTGGCLDVGLGELLIILIGMGDVVGSCSQFSCSTVRDEFQQPSPEFQQPSVEPAFAATATSTTAAAAADTAASESYAVVPTAAAAASSALLAASFASFNHVLRRRWQPCPL
jgi:hypothetical protein